jgi:hypothetical protein
VRHVCAVLPYASVAVITMRNAPVAGARALRAETTIHRILEAPVVFVA